MRYLLDTHAFIWLDANPHQLSATVLQLIEDQRNLLYLSVASVWEMQIKLQMGKLHMEASLSETLESQQVVNQIQILPILLPDVLALQNLPLHHKDPFDRLLIAQAVREGMPIISKDVLLHAYPVQVIWS